MMDSLENSSDPMLCAVLDVHSPVAPHHSDDYRHLGDVYHGRLSPHSGSIISTSNYNNNYATLTTMQSLPPISTVTSSSQEKYIIIQSNGASTSIGSISPPPRMIKHSFSHSDSALSDCDLSATSQSELAQFGADAANNYYLNSTSQEPSPPSASSATSSSNSSAYNSIIPTYNVNIKYEYDLKDDDPLCIETSSFLDGTSNICSNDQRNCHGPSAHFIAVPYSGGSLQPKLEIYTSANFDTGDLLDGVSILEDEKLRSPTPQKHSPLPADYSNCESPDSGELEELNTRDLAHRISSELKRYSIPQAIFAQRVLCRSQGTLSDLLRNPKPWSKLKSGRETFRRMAKWLQEPEFQRMSALRLAACKRKEEQTTSPAQPAAPKKPRLVFTDIQRRTLQAIFKETKRPSREMQLMISQQLGLDITTVANFFMNARRRGHDRESANNEQNISSSASNESRTAANTPTSVTSGNESDYCTPSLSELHAQVQQVVQQVQAEQLAEQQQNGEKKMIHHQPVAFTIVQDGSHLIKVEDYLEDENYGDPLEC
uniref:One cut domain family member n=1 Tax=Panagrolaimus sp. JU765 TaxID=591449 RepID=A0AC34RAY0_9BILA